MKKIVSTISVFALLLVCLLTACSQPGTTDHPWADATYTEDTTLGEGNTTLTVVVAAEGKEITLTVKTDQTTVGDALLEHGLIEGEQQSAGLYLKKVNGITADWNTDHTYWAFYEKDAYAMTGVDATTIQEGVLYALVRTAG